MDRNFARLPGRPWLGANFWSRVGGPLMWRSYDPDVIRQELAVLCDHGLTVTSRSEERRVGKECS